MKRQPKQRAQCIDRSELLAKIIVKTAEREKGSPMLDQSANDLVTESIIKYTQDNMTRESLKTVIQSQLGSLKYLTFLDQILSVASEVFVHKHESEVRGKQDAPKHFWTQEEDIRLYAAIYKLGTGYWPQISQFVGNKCTRIQCYQRWTRVLQPDLTPYWTEEEVAKLIELANSKQYSWGHIATVIKTKSDLQCRYKYSSLVKLSCRPNKQPPPDNQTFTSSEDDAFFLHSTAAEWLDTFHTILIPTLTE